MSHTYPPIMIVLLVLFSILHISVSTSKFHTYLYGKATFDELLQARTRGEEANKKYLTATQNASEESRNYRYESFFLECNNIGKERTRLIEMAVDSVPDASRYKILLTFGLQPFVARFLTLPLTDIKDGVRTLCTKLEQQLQCQEGFGESRAMILSRLDKLKKENGNLRILLEEQCAKPKFDVETFHCIGDEPLIWSKPCFKEMLAYNYTRYSAGRRIAKAHVKATFTVDQITSKLDLEDPDDILPLKDLVQNIMKDALQEIANIEAEKCDALKSVLKCVLPAVLSKCGSKAEYMLKTIVLQGYLPRERREILQSHFVGFEVESHPKCTALHPYI